MKRTDNGSPVFTSSISGGRGKGCGLSSDEHVERVMGILVKAGFTFLPYDKNEGIFLMVAPEPEDENSGMN